jgi:hypothetical protein
LLNVDRIVSGKLLHQRIKCKSGQRICHQVKYEGRRKFLPRPMRQRCYGNQPGADAQRLRREIVSQKFFSLSSHKRGEGRRSGFLSPKGERGQNQTDLLPIFTTARLLGGETAKNPRSRPAFA